MPAKPLLSFGFRLGCLVELSALRVALLPWEMTKSAFPFLFADQQSWVLEQMPSKPLLVQTEEASGSTKDPNPDSSLLAEPGQEAEVSVSWLLSLCKQSRG